jgi:DNA-binding NtrC family response regulator
VQAGLAGLPSEVLAELRGRHWPGNARELRNVVQAYAVLGALPEPGAQTTADLDIALRKSIDPSRGYAEQKERLLERFLRIYLELVLEKTGGNQSLAAKVSGLERSYLNKLVNRLRANRWEAPEPDD